ncbi:flagellar export chaperone FliS [Silvimonas iriomotensis]|uniref:Flagellar protein FliS n=1 Tax=Silvimonas iriomotensis TaxID=449662 RepID=A0ABQ2P5M1_9NEIS|nr:flagellar export chaperone FliS [Silvimonas iriomotensis]GGP18607.1 flagellar protein FliS [Silvimonas iriomotensis]
MSYAVKKALASYGQNSVDMAVASASPLKLVVMLYEGAIKAVGLAKHHMQAGNIADKGQSISKAIAIIDEGLRQSLDVEKGGELGKNLDALYEHMVAQLFKANIENNVQILDHVNKLLIDLKSAWDTIEQNSRGTTVTPPPPATPAPGDDAANRSALSYGRA